MPSFTQLKNLLQKPLHKYGLSAAVQAITACDILREIIVAEIHGSEGKFQVRSFRNNVFNIATSSSLAQKIDMQKMIILERVEGELKESGLKLRFIGE